MGDLELDREARAELAWTIDDAAIRRLEALDQGPAPGVAPVRRRGFLASSGASLLSLPAMLPTDLHFAASPNGFDLLRGATVVWSVRLDWLADLRAEAIGLERTGVRLTGRLPGSGLTLACQAELCARAQGIGLRLQHSLWQAALEVDIAAWLAGVMPAQGEMRDSKRLIQACGVAITHAAPAWMQLKPDLSLMLRGEGAFAVSGRRLSGRASQCGIGTALERIGRMPMEDDAVVAHVAFEAASDAPMAVAPDTRNTDLKIRPFKAHSARLELREAARDRTAATLIVRPAGAVALRHQATATSLDARIELFGARYVVEAASQMIVADQASVTVRTEDAVLQASTPKGSPTRIATASGKCSIHCPLQWTRFAFAHDGGITMQLRRDAPPEHQGLDEFLDGAPWHPSRLDMDHIELVAMRAEDGLLLRFRFVDVDLVRLLTGFRLAFRSDRARMRIELPAQAVAEEAFFRAPDWHASRGKPASDEYGVPYASMPNEQRKSLQKAKAQDYADRQRETLDGSSPVPAFRLAAARVSGESQLCFAPAGNGPSCRLHLDDLLDQGRWRLVVADNAYSSLATWQARPGNAGRFPPDTGADDLARVTHLEMPWRMHISPSEAATIVHTPLQRVAPGRFQPLFFLSPQEKTDGSSSFRAIYSEDSASSLQNHFTPESGDVRFSLDARDRNELVWLTARWGRQGLFGTKNVVPPARDGVDYGTYEPQPFQVDRIRLTSFGGGMQSEGTWDPPYLKPDAGTPAKAAAFALSIEQWGHRSSLARTQYERVEYRGWLLPFGFRASLIKLTRREIDDWEGHATAPDIQRYYIRSVEPVLQYPLVGQPPESANGFCQPERFELLQPNDLQIDDPGIGLVNNLGPSAFRVKVAGKSWTFDIAVGDGGVAHCSLVFVDNTATHNLTTLQAIAGAYNGDDTGARTMTMKAVPVRYAPSTRDGDTTFPTDRIELGVQLNVQLVDSTLLEAAKQPPIYPIMKSASIAVRSIQTQTQDASGQAPLVDVTYNALYNRVGFLASANSAEAVLDLNVPQKLGFQGRSDRAGGIANPDSTARSLSRSKGLLSYSPSASDAPPAAAARFARARAAASPTVGSLGNVFDTTATLFGVVKFSDLLGALDLGDLPQLIESAEQRFNATGNELLGQVALFLTKATGAVQQLRDTWANQGSGESDWLNSGLYLQIAVPLGTLADDLEPLRSAVQQSDLPQVAQCLATVGKDVSSLVTAVDTLSRRPELVMGDLLAQNEIGDLLKWFADVRGEWLKSGASQVLVVVAQADAAASALQKSLQDDFDAVAEMERIDLAQTRQARAVLAAVQRAIGQVVGAQPQDAVPLLQSLLVQYPPLYALQQQAFDQIAAANELLDTGAFSTAVSALAQTLAAQEFRSPVLTACSQWQRALDDAFAASTSAATAAAKAAATASMSDVLAMLKQVCAAEHPGANAKAAPRQVKDSAFLRIGLELSAAAIEVSVQLDAATDADVRAIAQRVRGVAATLAKALLAPFGFDTPSAVQAWKALGEAAAMLQAAAPAKTIGVDYANLLQSAVDGAAAAAAAPVAGYTALQGLDYVHALLSMSSHALALRGCLANPASDECLKQWPGVSTALSSVNDLLATAFQAAKVVLGTFFKNATAAVQNAGESALGKSILGPALVDQFTQVASDGQKLLNLNPAASADWVVAASTLGKDFSASWNGLVDLLSQAGFFRSLKRNVVDLLRSQLQGLAQDFVPATIRTSYTFTKKLQTDVGIFKPGLGDKGCTGPDADSAQTANFDLNTDMQADLLAGTSSYSLSGRLSTFRIDLAGFITLPVKEIRFRGSSSSGFHLDKPDFCMPFVDGALQFVQDIMELIGGGSGLFVEPAPSGVRAGYRLMYALLQAGGMTLQNLDFEVAVTIPFDGNAMTVDVGVGSEESPVLLSIGIYGGGGYVTLSMQADKLVSITAAFEAGLVGAFDLAIVSGTGRVTVGVYFHQAGNNMTIGGTFYIGGHATVLGIVSIAADLAVTLVSDGHVAQGTGRFSVRVGYGFFAWSLSYSVSHQQGSEPAGNHAALARARLAPGNAPAGLPPPSPAKSFQTHDQLVEPAVWQAYRSAFVEVAA